MKRLIIALLLFTTLGAYTQNVTKEDLEKEFKPFVEKVKTLQSENIKLKTIIKNINLKLSNSDSKISNLQKQLDINNQLIKELGVKIQQTEKNNDEKISDVDRSLSKNSLLGIIGVLCALLLSGLLFWLLNKKQINDKTDFIDKLSKTKSTIEESLVKEFGRQTELMDSQLQVLKQQKVEFKEPQKIIPDHSLALKVASEINLIERNINLMEPKTKGLKQLHASVGKLKDNLLANGYEMPELLGKQFHQGMKVIVTSSIPDENLEKDTEKISKILIPQVNFNDKMIQTAQIEVSIGC
jgi:hypothetical protein